MNFRIFIQLVFISVSLILLTGCQKESVQKITQARAMINPSSGSNVKGTVTFTRTESGITVVADIEGLTPGKHGFHIHENGDCSAPDASSAGAHFNPNNKEHAGHESMSRHDGDMGNITADENGNAHLKLTDTMMSFEGNNSIIGKSVIVHEKEDDLKTQPTGNSGARIGCGIIEKTF